MCIGGSNPGECVGSSQKGFPDTFATHNYMPKCFYTAVLEHTRPGCEFFSLFVACHGNNDKISGTDARNWAGRYAFVDRRLKVSSDLTVIDVLDSELRTVLVFPTSDPSTFHKNILEGLLKSCAFKAVANQQFT